MSDNPIGADNQQETEVSTRPLDPNWVVGFVDGEGCFSVSLHHNPRHARKSQGWQINSVFHVYQHSDYRTVLDQLVETFQCGKVRAKGAGSDVLTYVVSRRIDLEERVIPFFDRYRPIVKAQDFDLFRSIVVGLRRREHFHRAGFERLVRSAYAMNRHGKQRKRSLDEILRDPQRLHAKHS